MGVEPFLVASSLMAVLAQRLVRVICPHCKEPYTPSEIERAYFEKVPPGVALTLYRGRGCDKCQSKGYLGRTAIFETLIISDAIRQMISDKIDSQSIKSAAVSGGMKTLRNDGFEKVLKGITTVEEVLRVTQKDLIED
jgi:type II secretory ATPase GspE/PulE/Tfp pilus assembly ATPase PilB-like protein